MCGLSAFFDLCKRPLHSGSPPKSDKDEERERLLERLDRSVESRRYRGPDAKGTWIAPDNNVGLGHVRLCTRDLSSAGTQPLHSSNEAEDIHVVVNGELYYDTSLRKSLEQEYTFQSTSDSEILIPLYKRYGTAFTHHLRGEFSLVLYDGKTQILVAARDRFGVKPLHYGRLLVATQCKGIVQLLANPESLQWDVQCLAQGGGHYGSRTLIEGIRKFPPGHILVVRADQAMEAPLVIQPYFRTNYTANKGGLDSRPAEELVTELRSRLLEAVRLRIVGSDVPVGVLLSGGVDSSAVAGMAAHVSKQRLAANNGNALALPTCFTIGFPADDDLDESAIARRTAEHLGLPFEKLVVTEQILADEFDEACWLGETLMWDLQHIAKKALSKHIASRGLKVVLNGDGSDELFGGYSHFVADRLLADDERRVASLQSVNSVQRERLQQDYPQAWFGQENKDFDENG
ncbi:hypothetical protein LTR85_008861 [Meristemomyces frigidus]|nr:hypothetical protein LTR85_008861 [Meristemomyces frigidus]